MRRAELAGHADPCKADDEEDLREREVADAERFLEGRTLRLDAGLGVSELPCGRRRRVAGAQRHARASPSSCQYRAHASSPSCNRCTRKNSFGAWKSSSAVENEKKTVSRPIWRLNNSEIGTVPPMRTNSALTP